MKRGRERRSVGGLVGGLLLLIAIFAVGTQLYFMQEKLETAKAQEDALSAEIAEVTKENNSLSESLERKGSREEMEKVAREELDMVYPNEKVFYAVGG